MSKTKIALMSAPAAVFAFGATPATATVDYDSYEQMFGEPITTSATGAPQRAAEAPVNMTIITQDQIVRSGANDIPGVLERLASLDVGRYTRGDAEVSVRGYNAPSASRLLVLVNNRQVYIDTYGYTNWDLIPVQLSEIRQIEVVRGPNTALFGLNAVGGVINIITYDPIYDDEAEVEARIGEPRYAQGSAFVTMKPLPNVGVRLSIGAMQEEKFNGDPSPIEPFSNTAAGAVAWDVTDAVRLDSEVTWSAEERFEPGGGTAAEYEQNSFKVGAVAETAAGSISGQIYSNWMAVGYDAFITPSSARRVLQIDNRVTVASVSLLSKPAAAHTTRVTAEFRRNSLKQSDAMDVRYDVLSLAGMWNWAVTDTVATTAAVRIDQLSLERTGPHLPGYPLTNDDYDRDLTTIGANAGAVWRPSAHDTLRLSLARGAQSPSLIEFGLELLSGGAFLSGNPNLDPTYVNNAEIGWDHKLTIIPATLRTSVFWQKTEDLKQLAAQVRFVNGAILSESANTGESQMVGFEAGLHGGAGPLTWFAEYSRRSYDDNIKAALASRARHYQDSSPNDVVTAGADWIGARFEYGASVRFVGETDQPANGVGANPNAITNVDAYTQLNLRLAWKPVDTLMLELSGRDLLEEQTTTTNVGAVERAAYLTLRKSF